MEKFWSYRRIFCGSFTQLGLEAREGCGFVLFHPGNCADSDLRGVCSVSQPARCVDDSCPVGLVKMRLPSCQLEDVNTASACSTASLFCQTGQEVDPRCCDFPGLLVSCCKPVRCLPTASLCPWKLRCWVTQQLAEPSWCWRFGIPTVLTNTPSLRLQGRSEFWWNPCVNWKGNGVARSRKDLAATFMVFQHVYK